MRKFNKKGFTLVELIVVITVLAVLAAILVPMMVGYILHSRIAAANSGAGRIRDSITYFLTQADCKGYGMGLSKSVSCELEIVIDDTGEWQITVSDPTVFSETEEIKWESTGRATASIDLGGSANATERLAYHLASTFPGEHFGYVKTRFIGGVCDALYYTKDQNTAVDNFPDFGEYNGWEVPDFEWLNAEQGLYNLGIVVGTSPVLPLTDV